ncbi:AAA family ATPase [Methanosarcina sp.]|uniref:AAA family ATPase n=1 Tax=Methanosarcina sp. TaxID=2213 RepID=UPI003BB7AFEF
MKLKSIFIKGLFGKFDHKIPLNLKDKITIIYGLNGYGKTTVLKLINSFFKEEYLEIKKIPFYYFQLDFDQGESIRVYKNFFFLAVESLTNNDYNNILLKSPMLDGRYLHFENVSLKKSHLCDHDLKYDTRLFFEYRSQFPKNWEIFAYNYNEFEKIPIKIEKPDLQKIVRIKKAIENKIDDKEFVKELINKKDIETSSYKEYDPRKLKEDILDLDQKNLLNYYIIENLMKNKYFNTCKQPNNEQNKKEIDFLKRVQSSIFPQLIESQRLLYYDDDEDEIKANYQGKKNRKKYVYSVNVCSEEIKQQISKCYDDYSSTSQKLDKTFPNRLINAIISENEKENRNYIPNLKYEFEALEELQNQLNQLGLYSYDGDNQIRQLSEPGLHQETLLALKLYIDDNKKKLEVFSDLKIKMQNFSNIIEKLFKNKEIIFSQNKGLTFLDTDTRIELDPDQLSSGEQHLVVLFFDLLFRSKEGALILIDEPEISLHVSWQRKFIEILSEITKIVNMDIIVSTHSPSIVHDRMDLTVQLDGVSQ